MSETYGTFATAYVEAMRLRLSALESENKGLRKRAELADGDVKRAQAILDASNKYIRRIEVELQSESQAKIDAEFHVAALKERVAELEAREKQAREDEAWANGDGLVELEPVTSGWVASTLDGLHSINATAPTIHGALRALRDRLEAKP